MLGWRRERERLLFQEWRGDQPGGKEGGRLLDY